MINLTGFKMICVKGKKKKKTSEHIDRRELRATMSSRSTAKIEEKMHVRLIKLCGSHDWLSKKSQKSVITKIKTKKRKKLRDLFVDQLRFLLNFEAR